VKTNISTNTSANILLLGIIIFWPDFFTIFWQKFLRQFLRKLKLMQNVRANENFCENFRENSLIFAWFSLFAKMKKNRSRFNPIMKKISPQIYNKHLTLHPPHFWKTGLTFTAYKKFSIFEFLILQVHLHLQKYCISDKVLLVKDWKSRV
jgi:hypothetical protein